MNPMPMPVADDASYTDPFNLKFDDIDNASKYEGFGGKYNKSMYPPIMADLETASSGEPPGRYQRYPQYQRNQSLPKQYQGNPNLPRQYGDPNAPRQYPGNTMQYGDPNAPRQYPGNTMQYGDPNVPRQYPGNTMQYGDPNAPRQYPGNSMQYGDPNAPRQYPGNPMQYGNPNAPRQYPGNLIAPMQYQGNPNIAGMSRQQQIPGQYPMMPGQQMQPNPAIEQYRQMYPYSQALG